MALRCPILTDLDVEYEPPSQNQEHSWTADFYLPTHATYTEANGYLPGLPPNEAEFTEKLDHLNQHNETTVVVKNATQFLTELQARNVT